MNWKRRMGQDLLFALLGGIGVSALYLGFLFTRSLHGFAVKALGPAIDLVWHHLDTNCYTRSYCVLEEFAMNIVLYTFAIFTVLLAIDVLRQLTGKRLR